MLVAVAVVVVKAVVGSEIVVSGVIAVVVFVVCWRLVTETIY